MNRVAATDPGQCEKATWAMHATRREAACLAATLTKRLSDKLYLSFEQAIGTTAEYLVKLDYALTQRVSVRGQTGTTSGVGLFYRYAWD